MDPLDLALVAPMKMMISRGFFMGFPLQSNEALQGGNSLHQHRKKNCQKYWYLMPGSWLLYAILSLKLCLLWYPKKDREWWGHGTRSNPHQQEYLVLTHNQIAMGWIEYKLLLFFKYSGTKALSILYKPEYILRFLIGDLLCLPKYQSTVNKCTLWGEIDL